MIEPAPDESHRRRCKRRGLTLNPPQGAGSAGASIVIARQAANRAGGRAAARHRGPAKRRWWSRSWPAARSASWKNRFTPGTAVVRAMPNMPASIGRGITVAVANKQRDGARSGNWPTRCWRPPARSNGSATKSCSTPSPPFRAPDRPMSFCSPKRWQRPPSRPVCRRRWRRSWRVKPSQAPANCCANRRSMPPCCGRT